jgi:hypothetical protein
MSPARRRGQDAAPNRRNDLDRVEHRHTINTGGTAAKPTTNIKINNNSYTENLTGSPWLAGLDNDLIQLCHGLIDQVQPLQHRAGQPGMVGVEMAGQRLR